LTSVAPQPQPATIEAFLRQSEEKELLRFSTAGSVDDGKSTLIGRLLYDSKGLYEDQLAAIKNSKLNRSTGPIDFSLLTDGLKAEREQGITIDVAYRYFSTPRRKFIIADTPGHEQYTRNMATGASTAHAAIILIDARNGVLPQSRRHAFIAVLLGIPHLIVAVNKMDLVDYREQIFRDIEQEFRGFLGRLGANEPYFVPISALEGDNVVNRGERMPWHGGPALLEHLETIPAAASVEGAPMRFPVQYVNRPNLDFRGFAGQVASGEIRRGDVLMALPSGRTSRVKSIVTYDGDLETAFSPMSVTVCLEDEIDVSRGDLLVRPNELPHVSRHLEAHVVWMHQDPMKTNHPYLLKHTSHQVRGTVTSIGYRVDVNSLHELPAERLELNEIGRVSIETSRPLFFDAYRQNRITGSFILIDPLTNATAGAGMIAENGRTRGSAKDAKAALLELETGEGRVTPAERYARSGHYPSVIWLTGREDLAYLLERRLFDRGCSAHSIAGECESHIVPEVAKILYSAGMIAICAVAGDDATERERARQYSGGDRFVETVPESLSPRDEEAASQILGILEERGIISRHERFDEGEGI
jgi:sulfate adenylyltransferase large subunit